MDRMYRTLTGAQSDEPWTDSAKWGALLLNWARHTEEGELRTARFREGIKLAEAVLSMSDAPSGIKAVARVNRAVALGETGEIGQAMAEYGQVIDDLDAPPQQRAIARLNRAERLRQKGDLQRANADLTAVIDDPSAPPYEKVAARLRRAAAFSAEGNTSMAKADLTELIEDTRLPPEPRGSAWHGLAELSYKEGDFIAASEALRQAHALVGEHEYLRAELGLALLRSRRVDEALAEYQAAIQAMQHAEELDGIVTDELQSALLDDPDLPGAEAVLEMVERRKQELAAAQKSGGA
jgi:tetratricopeptide (TPR) repeat protein